MSRKKEEMFKLDNQITWYLKDYEDDKKKQKKLERNNGELFYIFHKEEKDEETMRS